MLEVREGVVAGLEVAPGTGGAPALYSLKFTDGHLIPLNDRIGSGIEVKSLAEVECRHCAKVSKRSFGGGYCYDCFSTLARCDLCVVSPDRCHYAQGTCREPAWGEAFCKQPHLVDLANSSGAKEGITRRGREVGRWLEQGAIQGLDILEADTRRDAGLAEVLVGQRLPDRTDWKKMLRGDVPEVDLTAIRHELQAADLELPNGVRWLPLEKEARFHYPLHNQGPAEENLKLDRGDLRGNLLGMKAQYLMIGTGAFNVRQHAGYRVRVQIGPPLPEDNPGGRQLGLF